VVLQADSNGLAKPSSANGVRNLGFDIAVGPTKHECMIVANTSRCASNKVSVLIVERASSLNLASARKSEVSKFATANSPAAVGHER
jgi:hypothetical protein